jgi:hypothetical protein
MHQEPFSRFIQGRSWEQKVINADISVNRQVPGHVLEEHLLGIFLSDTEKADKRWELHLENEEYDRSREGRIRHNDLLRLRPTKWLNDEIVNVYIGLLRSVPKGKMTILPSWIWMQLTDIVTTGKSKREAEFARRRNILLNRVCTSFFTMSSILIACTLAKTNWK